MTITHARVVSLLRRIADAVPDQLDCDGCFELIAEFAEAELRGDELSDTMRAVQTHLSQCPCCAYEYKALVEAVRDAEAID